MDDDTDEIIDLVTDQMMSNRHDTKTNQTRERVNASPKFQNQYGSRSRSPVYEKNIDNDIKQKRSIHEPGYDSIGLSQRIRLERAKSYLESRYKQDQYPIEDSLQNEIEQSHEEHDVPQQIETIESVSDAIHRSPSMTSNDHPQAMPGMRAWTALVKKRAASPTELIPKEPTPLIPAKQSIVQLKEKLKARMQNSSKITQIPGTSYQEIISPDVPSIEISPTLSNASPISDGNELDSSPSIEAIDIHSQEWMKEFISTFGLMRSYSGTILFPSGSFMNMKSDLSATGEIVLSSFDFRSKNTSPPFIFVPLSPRKPVTLFSPISWNRKKQQQYLYRHDTMTISSKYSKYDGSLSMVVNERVDEHIFTKILQMNPELSDANDRWNILSKHELTNEKFHEILEKSQHISPSLEEIQHQLNYYNTDTIPSMSMSQSRYSEDINDAFVRLSRIHERITEVSSNAHQLSLIDEEPDIDWKGQSRFLYRSITHTSKIGSIISQDTFYLILSWILALLLQFLWLLAAIKRSIIQLVRKVFNSQSIESEENTSQPNVQDIVTPEGQQSRYEPLDRNISTQNRHHRRASHRSDSSSKTHRRQLS